MVLEGDSRGRANISALDDNGAGHGHRLAGPKYIEDRALGVTTPTTFRKVLDAEDVEALHGYLRVWDEIHLSEEPPAWAALVEASDRYRQATNRLARVRGYQDFPAKRLAGITADRAKAWSTLVTAAAALGAVEEGPK